MGQDRGKNCRCSVMEYITFGSCVRYHLFGLVFVNGAWGSVVVKALRY